MKFIIFALFVASASADNHCQGVYFKDKYYNVEIIKEGLNHVYQMALNQNDNTVYFTFDQISDVPSRILGFFNLNTRKAGFIEGIRNATGVAIDQVRNKVYVGGSQGLFSLNDKMVPEKLPVDDNIKSLFFKDVLYYTTKRRGAYKFEYGVVNPVGELQGVEVDKLVTDDDNNIFFTQNDKLFRVKMGTRLINTHEKYSVDVLTTDSTFKPYVAAKDGVYVYNKYKYALDKVSHFVNLRELTFNKMGDPVYVVAGILAKLNYNPIPCFGD